MNNVTSLPSPEGTPEGARPARSMEWEGMLFRSVSEYRLARAFDQHGIWVIPNARGQLGFGPSRRTLEVDVLVNIDGVWVAVEVDGAPWHPPSRAVEDNRRQRLFMIHGVSVLRFDADEAYNRADEVVAVVVAHAEAMRRAWGR
jgi:hypothetical protein